MGRLIHHGPLPAHPLPVRSDVLQMVRVALRAPLVFAPRRPLGRPPAVVTANALPRVVRLAKREELPALPATEQKKYVPLHAPAFPNALLSWPARPDVARTPPSAARRSEGLGCYPRPSSVSLARFDPSGLSEGAWPIFWVKFLRICVAVCTRSAPLATSAAT